MSFRTQPAPKRNRRPAWERDDRRALYTNLAFIGVILLSVVILFAAAAATYYDDHYGTVATVEGVTINKDDLRAQVAVDSWRIQRIATNIQNSVSSGRLTQEQADQQLQTLQTQQQQIPQSSLEALADGILQTKLLEERGQTVSEAEIDAALLEEATSPEIRNVWVIQVSPELSAGQTAPTAAAKAAALKKLQDARAEISSGKKKWEDVAKAISTDASAQKGGDLGYVSADAGTDDLLKALFQLKKDELTEVIEIDGAYRLGRVTDIVASAVDQNYQQAIVDAKVPLEGYRLTIKHELVRKALEAKVVADVVDTATVQRRVSQIELKGTPGSDPVDEVKSAHILFSPKGDAAGAGSLSSGDPAWALAEKSANTAYETLKKDPTKFAELAKAFSSDTSSAPDGGDLPWFKQADVDASFGTAIFRSGLTKGQILPPVRSVYGYHVIRYEDRRPGPGVRIKTIRTDALKPGADFAALAKADSEASDADSGGEMGWIARGQLDKALEDAIFAAPIGKVSEILETDTGWYLFLVKEEATRKPEGAQLETLKSSAFDNWYAAKREAAKIPDLTVPSNL
jgi:parvulin-like peptidyl-prolyl isomerase